MTIGNACREREFASSAPWPVQRIRAVFNRAAAGYDREPLRVYGFSADRLIRHAGIRPGQKVLDAGAGTGAVTFAAAQCVGPTGRVIAIDTAEQMLDRAQDRIGQFGITNVDLHLMDAAQPEFRSGYFDAVLCGHALDLMPDMEAAVRSWMRVVRPGGTIAFSGFGPGTFEPLAGLLRAAVARTWPPDAVPPVQGCHGVATIDCFRELAGTLGLAGGQVAEEPLGYHLRDAGEWWDIVMGSGLREPVDRLDAVPADAVRSAHLAEVARLAGADGLWLDVRVLFATATRS